MKFLLVGTNHAHQMMGSKHGSSLLFLDFLLKCCGECVDLIAEELSNEVLVNDSTTSTAAQAALEIGLPHLFCDPDTTERVDLGILSEVDIRVAHNLGAGKVGSVIDTIDREMRKQWGIREAEWLRRIEIQQRTCCLFVLGSEHLLPFSLLLNKFGHEYRILSSRWEPPSHNQ